MYVIYICIHMQMCSHLCEIMLHTFFKDICVPKDIYQSSVISLGEKEMRLKEEREKLLTNTETALNKER